MSITAEDVSIADKLSFELQSLVDSHTKPFVIIDRNYRIVAVNAAYAKAYSTNAVQAIGQTCYKISHHEDKPCHLSGEECPHEVLFRSGKRHCCVHMHHVDSKRVHQVQITAVPLHTGDGELYMGELLEPLTPAMCECEQTKRMVGNSRAFAACMDQLKLAAAANAPVLLQGETGTGKELAAGFIHDHSPRCDKPYLAVDCTALTDTLFEAEVFGHTKGAYTGSVGDKPGLFDQADGGTLLLDEVGELPMTQQAKLLRVLETGQYRRVGGRATREVNVRIICATNRHLWESVTAGTFREDLYYRIACLSVRLPSLRERIEDIPMLAECLLESIGVSMRRNLSLTPNALERLMDYQYPGNIRELRNILFAATTHIHGDVIQAPVIDRVIRQLLERQDAGSSQTEVVNLGGATPGVVDNPSSARMANNGGMNSLKDAEAQHISRLLTQHNGNRRKVAAQLEISERTLYRKLKKYHLT